MKCEEYKGTEFDFKCPEDKTLLIYVRNEEVYITDKESKTGWGFMHITHTIHRCPKCYKWWKFESGIKPYTKTTPNASYAKSEVKE